MAKKEVNREYKPEYAEQARKICVAGYNDLALAVFFETDFIGLATWAQENPEFLEAISVPESEIQAHADAIQKRRDKRAAWRKKSQTATSRIRESASSRMWSALKAQGLRKDSKFFERLGYTIDDLITHLQSKFKDGMTLENYGKWHVDHIKPCALFDLSDPEQFDECWALSNLQPLWARENIKKGAKYASS